MPAGAVPATLASVTDGDTIRVFVDGRNEPVRLILIDTPETRRPGSPIECFGPEATVYLQWLLSLGGDLYLETDVSNRDRYDRLLRYVWLELDGEVYLVNEVMARSGFASLSTYPPDVRYVEQIREAAAFAREHGYGLWTECVADSATATDAPDFVPSELEEPAATLPGEPVQRYGNVMAPIPVDAQDRPCADWDDACWDAYEALEAERAEEYDEYLEDQAAMDDYYDSLEECSDGGCDPAQGPHGSG